MPVTLSIRNVPDDVAESLRARARRNHRSVQGELMAIFEEAAKQHHSFQDERRAFRDDDRPPKSRLSPAEALRQMRALGVRTKDEVVQMIQEDRDR